VHPVLREGTVIQRDPLRHLGSHLG
jgi:hypothetical protein